MSTYHNIRLKVPFIGDSGVGKTSLIRCLIHPDNAFRREERQEDEYHSTIGIAFSTLHIVTEQYDSVSIHIWDTAGQERFNSCVPLFFRGSNIIAIVFDLSDKSTWESVQHKWLPMIEKYCGTINNSGVIANNENDSSIIINTVIALIGNKSDNWTPDNPDHVTQDQIDEYCFDKQLTYFQICARSDNRQELVEKCILKPLEKYKQHNPTYNQQQNIVKLDDDIEMQSGCYSRNKSYCHIL